MVTFDKIDLQLFSRFLLVVPKNVVEVELGIDMNTSMLCFQNRKSSRHYSQLSYCVTSSLAHLSFPDFKTAPTFFSKSNDKVVVNVFYCLGHMCWGDLLRLACSKHV